jgi:hypothetical protein
MGQVDSPHQRMGRGEEELTVNETPGGLSL